MNNINKTLIILLTFTLFISCEESIDQGITSINSIDEFTEELLAELIEVNFSKEYGGLKYEQEVFYNTAFEYIDDCDIEKKLVHLYSNTNEIFDVDIKWDYSKQCSEAVMVYNDRFHKVHNDESSQIVSSPNFKLDIVPGTQQNISGNFIDHKYQYFLLSLRNFSFLEGTEGDEKFSGTINFFGGSCLFNFENGNTNGQELDFRIRLNSSSIESDQIDQKGTIQQKSDGWEIKFENGGIYII